MMHADVEKLLRHVRERTGYEVAVVLEPSLKAFSTMRPASASVPTHNIWVDPKVQGIADYLVAVQAAMLLLAAGYVEKGQQLFAALRSVPEDAAERYRYAVDSWAQLLGMVGWYEWVRRKG